MFASAVEEKLNVTVELTRIGVDKSMFSIDGGNLREHRERLDGRMDTHKRPIIDLTGELAAPCSERVYFEREICRLRASAGEEEARHASALMRAGCLNGEV